MDNNTENNIYDIFKSIGCSDEKCQEVINLLSEDDLEYISGGKCESRKELVKKMLTLGLSATSICPVASFKSTFATDNKKFELKLDAENTNVNTSKNNLEYKNTTDIKNLNNKTSFENTENLSHDNNSGTVAQKYIENKNSNDKRKNDYIDVNNIDKNLAVKYYNHDNRCKNIKKFVIGTGTVLGLPTLAWLLCNKFSQDNINSHVNSNHNNFELIISEKLNSDLKKIYAILINTDICKHILDLYKKCDCYKFDILGKNNINQLNISTKVSSQNDLNSFSELFYNVICDWNAIHSQQDNFDQNVLFDITKPVSFEDFFNHVCKFEIAGANSSDLREFYKIINSIKNIKHVQTGTFLFKKRVIDIKIMFYNSKENIVNDINFNENENKSDDTQPEDKWVNILNDFKNYYSQICQYIAPGVKLNLNSTEISADKITNILSIIKEFNENFKKFSESRRWGSLGVRYKISEPSRWESWGVSYKKGTKDDLSNPNDPNNSDDPADLCIKSYHELKSNLKLINELGLEIGYYDFWKYLNNNIETIKTIERILELYKDIYKIEQNYEETIKKQFQELCDCTKILYKNSYKGDTEFKKITTLRLDLENKIKELESENVKTKRYYNNFLSLFF